VFCAAVQKWTLGVLNIKWEKGPASAFNKDNDKATFIVYNPVKGTFVTFQIRNHTIRFWMHYVSTEVYVGGIAVLNMCARIQFLGARVQFSLSLCS
jgi:hypothetical protein